MADPFQDMSTASPEMLDIIVAALESRAADPGMTAIIDAYLALLDWRDGDETLEVGSGTGGIARRIAAHAPGCRVLGIEPSPELVSAARGLAKGVAANVSFETGDARALDCADGRFANVVIHTVLSHMTDPAPALSEAFRVLRPGGRLVVCDADFSKLAMGIDDGDPLQACAVAFMRNFVTDPWLTARLRGMVAGAGFGVELFDVTNRLDLSGEGGGVGWVRMSTTRMVDRGQIGQPLADALLAEWERRGSAGLAYGFNPFVTLVARKPD